MGHVTTPEGIDFVIQSPPLTETEKKELSDFISKRKKQLEKKDAMKKRKKPAANKS